MKAMVLERLNEPLVLRDSVQTPILARGQVLVKLAYSGVCHSQLMETRGGRGPDRFLPHLLGHEGTGVVETIGEGVSKVRPGDQVILTWIKGSGIEAGGAKYRRGEVTINAGGVTTFNEKAVVSENRLVPLPEGLPMDLSVLFGCALLTGAGIVMNQIKPEKNSTVAVFGLGGIGLSALIALQLYSCAQIIAIDVEDEKLQLARELGATQTINSRNESAVETIARLTHGLGVDAAVEAGGLVSTIEQAFSSVKKNGGLCVFASHPPSGEKIALDPYDLISGKRIQGSWGGASNPDRDIPILAELYRKGKLPLEKLIGKRYRLDQINEALDDLEHRRTTRPLIEIQTTEKALRG